MRYSEVIVNMLKDGVEGKVDNYYDFFMDLTAKLGEEEKFSEGLLKENEEMFDVINDEDMYSFYVEEDTRDRHKCQAFLRPYYEKALKVLDN